MLKVKVEALENDLNDRGNETLDLHEKVVALETIVKEMNLRILNITTATKKGTNKRRRVKQHLTPSPSHNNEEDTVELVKHVIEELDQEDNLEHDFDTMAEEAEISRNSEEEYEISTEEILKMYESG